MKFFHYLTFLMIFNMGFPEDVILSLDGNYMNYESNADVAGFQFVLSDNPDVLSYVSVSETDRTAGFSISAAEGEGGVTLIGFSVILFSGVKPHSLKLKPSFSAR